MGIVKSITNPKDILNVDAKLTDRGFAIIIFGKKYYIEYPQGIWEKTPLSVRQVLMENVAYVYTNVLPLILGKKKISYNFSFPLFESTLFKNQLYDVLDCELDDHVPHLKYLREFYNLEVEFTSNVSNIPDPPETRSGFSEKSKHPVAILPFSFGKESLATFALCRELGIRPVMVYFQEPAHGFEAKRKRKLSRELEKEFGDPIFEVRCDPGLFRYGKAFGTKLESELGWGPQSTILALLSVPFVYAFGAKYIFFGSEYLNNFFSVRHGWKSFVSIDQTSNWTPQQSNMVRQLTGGRCSVHSILEPIDEINVFYLLHHRYPQVGKYQFSCMGQKPPIGNSNWCLDCGKCFRMSVFAHLCHFDLKKLGFEEDLLVPKREKEWEYFSEKNYPCLDTTFALYMLYRQKFKSPYIKKFLTTQFKTVSAWGPLAKFFTTIRPAKNLPPACESKITTIINEELTAFRKTLNDKKG